MGDYHNQEKRHTDKIKLAKDDSGSEIPKRISSPVMVADEKDRIPGKTPLNSVKSGIQIPTETIPTANAVKKEGVKPEAAQLIKDTAETIGPQKKIIAVGGAKGGVGKSVLSSNLAVGLALLDQRVVLADLDLGGSDVHLYVGVKSLAKTWNDFLDKKVDSIKDIETPTAFEGLTLIGGDSSKLGSANLPHSQKLKIMRHLKELACDYIIIDLGGNTTYNGLDFFLFADQKIVVTATEPASILDSYSFVKVAFQRFLERYFAEKKSLKGLGERVRDGSFEKSKEFSLNYIFEEVRARDNSAYTKLKTLFDRFNLSLVVNMAESRKDVLVAESIQKVLKEKCFLDVGILGTIPFDKVVRKAAREFTPIVVGNPRCSACKVIHQMLAAILLHAEKESLRAELLTRTNRIRKDAREKIDTHKMTLDGLTLGQIDSIYNRSPKLRQSFRKILNVLTN
ncbi:MAG: P-loop NTPase [Deltaproteobacteria bacterium]|nr:P-loop NTPase [Deltaproteobacteria bacterium]